jgi:alkanesulfonate monooxygenase SsuD/methylene tetrahydromethanopterin reductase-like flavin-dependent oxidoreductase (luciferase family)
MVTAVTYRPAALLIKAVTTLDVLSGGRAWLGIGAGYQTAEAVALDLPLPSTRERFEYLEDTVRLATHMWANQPTRFDGIHVHPHNAVGHPGPVTRPHPPILIGGMGEQRTLRLVAQHADACNLFDVPDGGATLRHKLAVLDRHCTEVGRPPDAVQRTVSTRLEPDKELAPFSQRCAALADLGIDHVVVLCSGPWTPDKISLLGAAQHALACDTGGLAGR